MGKRAWRQGQAPPLWFGALFILTGGAIAAVGAGWIPVDPESVHAPGWVIQLIGLVFALGGLMCYADRLGETLTWILPMAFVATFATVFSWVAFGPGERAFSGTVSLGPVGGSASSGETLGRVVFGFGAVCLWLLAVAMLMRWVRDRRQGS